MSDPFTNHTSDETLERYVLEQLPTSERDETDEHLLVCEQCRHRLAETEKLITAVRAAARDEGCLSQNAAANGRKLILIKSRKTPLNE